MEKGELGIFRPLGDQAVRIEFGHGISPATSVRIRQFCQTLEHDPIPGVVEWVPAYATVALYYRAHVVRYEALCGILEGRLAAAAFEPLPPSHVVEIPVCYDGPDLGHVAAFHGISPGEVVALHAAPTYLVYFLGFLPGFPYLGGLPDALATPRRDTPRSRVPAGAVGIAGVQTGVYPVDSPGGWQIIGHTSVRLYDPSRQPAALLRAGDEVRFVPQERHDDG